MDNKKKIIDKDMAMGRPTFESLLDNLAGLDQMMSDFLASETEGLIVCENCYDTAFDDDENLASFTDDEGQTHIFCCKECMEEWKGNRA